MHITPAKTDRKALKNFYTTVQYTFFITLVHTFIKAVILSQKKVAENSYFHADHITHHVKHHGIVTTPQFVSVVCI